MLSHEAFIQKENLFSDGGVIVNFYLDKST